MASSILIVDDEPQIRSLVRVLLSRMGFNLFEAGDGVEALELCENQHLPLDLLITDVMMPKMDGVALAERASQIYPDLRVIYMSGKSEADTIVCGIRERGFHFLRKPFQIDELRAKVAEMAATTPA
ncbi:MAG TPA: response regulator [Bryobacteraceae bacterium]|nr:response regulator [Bryobacteraceae bacterium]